DYNGFKVCLGKDTVHGKQIQELRIIMEQLILDKSSPQFIGKVTEYPIIPAYVDYHIKLAPKLKRKRIVLDAGNGTASTVAPALFEKLGAEVIPLFCELDGRFPNHHPDPTVPENLRHLISKVRETKADLGIAFDGDADRVGLVDETGRIFYGDEIMVLFSRAVLKERPGAIIISEVKSSHRLYNDIAEKGGKPLMWKTGHSLIKSKMKETGAALAGEMSGHIFFADRYFGFDDAIYAAVRLYEIACSTSAPFSTLLGDLPKVVSTPEIRVECVEDKKFELVAAAKRILKTKPYSINDIDGVRVDFGDGWGLIRASNTQPVLVLRFEAVSQQRLLVLRKEIESALAAAAKEIGHPDINTEGGHV
ncbi:phosphomannomutase/phosphoglucomutase, partial [Bdellovibrionota bacterium FG-2]